MPFSPPLVWPRPPPWPPAGDSAGNGPPHSLQARSLVLNPVVPSASSGNPFLQVGGRMPSNCLHLLR